MRMVVLSGAQRAKDLRRPLVLAFLILLSCSAATAQTAASAAITGKVVDPQGEPVPGAKIIIRSSDLAFTRAAVSDENGTFGVPALPSGAYTVDVSAPGLVLKQPMRVTVTVGGSVRISVQLGLAGTAQRVTVRGSAANVEGNTVAPAVNKQEPEMGNFIAGTTDTYLPNRDRDFSQFDQLGAGIVPNAAGTGVIVAGQRSESTKTSVDGADFDDSLEGGRRGASDGALFFPQTVVREFNIVHAGAGAEVGGTSAGSINVVTKEGSDKLHGEAFYTGRPSWLTSHDAFGHSLHNNQNGFGGSLGGPIKRGKAFYYAGAEQDFLDVPYWTEFAPQAPGVVLPPALTAQQGQIVETNHPTALFGRVDVLLNQKNTLNFELDFNRVRATNLDPDNSTRTLAAESDMNSLTGHSIWSRGSLTTLIGAHAVNELLAQWASDKRDFTPNSAAPEIVINGFGILGGSSIGLDRYTSSTREVSDDLAITRGAGALHFGGDFAYDPATARREANLNGRFDFDSLADYLADNPRRFQQTFATGTSAYSGAIRRLAFYVTDKWPITDQLTLTAGFRWDAQWNLQPPHPNPALPLTTFIPGDLRQWQPRLGLAWNPAKNTVIRISSGLYDAPTPAVLWQRVFADNGLHSVTIDSNYDPGILPLLASPSLTFAPFAAPPPGLTTPAAFAAGIESNFRSARSFQLSSAIEQQITPKISLTAGYLRASTWDLPLLANTNLAAPSLSPEGMPIFPITRPDPTVGQFVVAESAGHSSYDGFLLTTNFQLSRRTQIVANYTLSDTRDDVSNAAPFGVNSVLDPFNPSLDGADSAMDVRHDFNVSALFWLPLGFKIDPVFVAHSGLPYTPVVGFDTQNDGNDLNDRAILNGAVAGRDSLRQPAFYNLDLRFVKDITLRGEGHHLDLFMDIFNITGAANLNFGPDAISLFGTPAAPIFSAGRPLFAPSTSAFGGAREIQFTARLVAF